MINFSRLSHQTNEHSIIPLVTLLADNTSRVTIQFTSNVNRRGNDSTRNLPNGKPMGMKKPSFKTKKA